MDDTNKTNQENIEEVSSFEEQSPIAENSQEETQNPAEMQEESMQIEEEKPAEELQSEDNTDENQSNNEPVIEIPADSPARWYVVHTYSGHENRVAETLKKKVESEGLQNEIYEVLVPTQDKIEIKSGKKETVKEKIFPGYILVKMILTDASWLAIRTTQGVTSFVGMGNKPTPISEKEVRSIVQFMSQGAAPTYKTVFTDGDTVKIVDGPFSEFIGKVESVDKDRGKIKVLVSIFGRETPVELDFLQVQKL